MRSLIAVMMLFFAVSLGSAGELQWKKFNGGLADAKKSGKKVMIDVYTDWCKWCKTMDTVTYKDKKVKDYLAKNFVIIKLNAEGEENISYSGQRMSPGDFARAMRIDGYPATLFMQPDGAAITVLPGYSEPAMFLHVLTYIREDQYLKKNFDKYLSEKGVK